MEVRSAEFVMSNNDHRKCPAPEMPEYAFIGRSNVGKSSLLNMLAGKKDLAKISSKPGKTQLINHFIINNDWYLVDLPGFGYAKISKSVRAKFQPMITKYLKGRDNLMLTFVLIDSRHEPQKIDVDFIGWLADEEVPFAIIFTKADKLSKRQLADNIKNYRDELSKIYENLPVAFVSSAKTSKGKDDILNIIQQMNESVK